VTLSVVLITYNEEANLRRTLKSVLPLVRPRNGAPESAGEIIVVDNGSTDRTIEIARELGARVFIEEWKGFAAQKNSAIAKATGDWILSLDADEAVEPELAQEIKKVVESNGQRTPKEWCKTANISGDDPQERARQRLISPVDGYWLPRKNLFLGRWIKRAGFWPDRKLRLFRRGKGRFIDRPVHEVMEVDGPTGGLQNALIHNAYPTLTGYIATMNKYSSLGAELAAGNGHGCFSFVNILLRPIATFTSMYLLRLGFLDGREGLLLCLYHSVYVSWKYAKAWEIGRTKE
jgi:glycosyltransferase involved in cell wall biosynthesis